jgi:hypothetical protein
MDENWFMSIHQAKKLTDNLLNRNGDIRIYFRSFRTE